MTCQYSDCLIPLASTNKGGYCLSHRNYGLKVKGYKRKYEDKNREKIKQKRKETRNNWDSTYKKYKITAKEFLDLSAKQNSGGCNFVLGHAKDRPEVLRSAAEYLTNQQFNNTTKNSDGSNTD
jgi:hypothetical protein